MPMMEKEYDAIQYILIGTYISADTELFVYLLFTFGFRGKNIKWKLSKGGS